MPTRTEQQAWKLKLGKLEKVTTALFWVTITWIAMNRRWKRNVVFLVSSDGCDAPANFLCRLNGHVVPCTMSPRQMGRRCEYLLIITGYYYYYYYYYFLLLLLLFCCRPCCCHNNRNHLHRRHYDCDNGPRCRIPVRRRRPDHDLVVVSVAAQQ